MSRTRLALLALSTALAFSSVPSVSQAQTLSEIFAARRAARAEANAAADTKTKRADASTRKKVADKKAKADKKVAAKTKVTAPVTKVGTTPPGVFSSIEMAGAPTADEVLQSGNNGELRSNAERKKIGVFAAMLGVEEREPDYLPQTRALDARLADKDAKRPFRVKPEFMPQEVTYTGYKPGTIVIDTEAKFLYLMETDSTARRYAIAVGRQGLQYKGAVTVGDKQEWPRWIPTKEMQERDPKKYGQYKDGMPGGVSNPLGARAIYLYDGKKDTHLRIHGTTEPQSIGTSASNGCFRMINEHVQELYSRVKVGTNVVVL